MLNGLQTRHKSSNQLNAVTYLSTGSRWPGVLFQSDSRYDDRVDCLCRSNRYTSFRAQLRGLITYLSQGLICPKSGTVRTRRNQRRVVNPTTIRLRPWRPPVYMLKLENSWQFIDSLIIEIWLFGDDILRIWGATFTNMKISTVVHQTNEIFTPPHSDHKSCI